jgi:hypothetical protein
MTISATAANYKINEVIKEIKQRKRVLSVFKHLKADWGQKIPSVFVEKSYAIIGVREGNKAVLLKISLSNLV